MPILAATLLLAAVSSSPSKDARLLAEADRIGTVLDRVAPSAPKEFGDIVKMSRDALDNVRKARTADVRLYRLRLPSIEAEMLAYLGQQQAAGKDSAAFTSFWSGRESRFAAAPQVRGTLLEKALQQAAINRAEKLFKAALPYAKADGPSSGLYYVSEAEAGRRYADFVRSVATGADEAPPLGRATLQKALDDLYVEVIAAYEKDPSGRAMLSVSAKMKEARELIEAGRLEGATLALLESRYELSKRSPKPGAATKPMIAPRDSFGALWMELAAAESVPENARAIREDVIPLYAAMLAHPVAGTAQRKTAAVTVTLIRWPYT